MSQKIDGTSVAKKISKKVEFDPNLVERYFRRGRIYEKRKQYLKSLIQYSKVIELQPTYPNIYKLRGVIYYRLGNYGKSVKDLDITIQKESKNNYRPYQLLYVRGNSLMKLNKRKKALSDFEEVYLNSKEKNYKGVKKNLAILHKYLKKWKLCLKFCKEADKEKPECPETTFVKAYALEKLKKYNESHHNYQRAERFLLSEMRKQRKDPKKVKDLSYYTNNLPSQIKKGLKRAAKNVEKEDVRNFRETITNFTRETLKIDQDIVELYDEEGEEENEGEDDDDEDDDNNNNSIEEEESNNEKKVIEKYNELLEEAKTLEEAKQFLDFDSMKIITYLKDKKGRNLVLLKESPFTKDQVKKLMYYFILRLDPIVQEPYVIMWSLYNPSASHEKRKKFKSAKPGLSFCLNSYRSLTRKFRKNCQKVVLLHPNFYTKLLLQFFKKAMSSKAGKKIVLVSDIFKNKELDQIIDVKSFRFPVQVYVANAKRNKTRPPKSSQFLFGKNVDVCMSLPINEGRAIPEFVESLLSVIETKLHFKGIFRKAGGNLAIKEMKEMINYGYKIDFSHSSIHVNCSVIKLWFREMPEKIFTEKLFDELTGLFPDPDVEEVKEIVEKLPEKNSAVLRELFKFLGKIVAKRDENLMDPKNLAIVFGPNLLKKAAMSQMQSLAVQGNIIGIVEFMIANYKEIF